MSELSEPVKTKISLQLSIVRIMLPDLEDFQCKLKKLVSRKLQAQSFSVISWIEAKTDPQHLLKANETGRMQTTKMLF